MAEYHTLWRPEARDELRRIPQRDATRILRKLTELEHDPLGFGTTALVGDPDVHRLRVGAYRVLYTLDGGELVVWVLRVDHRSNVHTTPPPRR